MEFLKSIGRSLLKSEFDDLRRAHAETERARMALEISNGHLQVEVDRVWERMDAALENERRALRFHANVKMETQFGAKPYPEEPGLPAEERAIAEQPQKAYQQGAAITRKANQEFIVELERRKAAGEYVPIEPEMLADIFG